MGFIQIDKIISRKFGKSPVAKQVTAALVCEEFDKLMLKVIGEKVKNMAQTMYLKDKVLTIACLSPLVAGELKMREEGLVEKVNQKFGQGVVERLRFLT